MLFKLAPHNWSFEMFISQVTWWRALANKWINNTLVNFLGNSNHMHVRMHEPKNKQIIIIHTQLLLVRLIKRKRQYQVYDIPSCKSKNISTRDFVTALWIPINGGLRFYDGVKSVSREGQIFRMILLCVLICQQHRRITSLFVYVYIYY